MQNLILDTTVSKSALDIIADINENATTSSTSIPRSKLLLVTLTTTIMMAKNTPLPKEYYQYTRAFLSTIRHDDGTSLPNISEFLKFINKFEEKHNIEDNMEDTRIAMPSDEKIEVQLEETFNEDELNNQTKEPLSSTKKTDEDAENTVATDLSGDKEEEPIEDENKPLE